MKRIILLIPVISFLFTLNAQVQIRPAPEPGYDIRIRDFVNHLRVVDTHEHLINPEGIRKSGMLDFMLLLHHYADDDIKSAGMPKQLFGKLLTDSLTVMGKWQTIKPYWEVSSNTAYNRAVLLSADKLFGIRDINDSTVAKLSERIRNAYQTDWFNTVLKEKCMFDYVVVDSEDRSFGDQGMLRYVKRFDYINIDSRAKIEAISKRHNDRISTVDDLVTSLEHEFTETIKEGFVAIKIGVAYQRILYFEDVSKTEAEEILRRILHSKSNKDFSADQAKPLQDYMTHRVLDMAGAANIPVQIHTGLQAGDGNIIENSNPAHLANLFLKYRDVKFILFHGGYPFGGELAALAKNFRNVYIDMCWLYIISPSYSERYLHEWLETVPANKIMAFGGDFHNVEGIYGHLMFAKQVVSNVLVEKTRDGYFTEDEAKIIAGMIFHDNAVTILNLKKK